MKKALPLLLAAALLLSCKKSYTCVCKNYKTSYIYSKETIKAKSWNEASEKCRMKMTIAMELCDIMERK